MGNASTDDLAPVAQWLTIALAFVAQWEGCRLTAYPDPATGDDPWTIGYGATGPAIHQGTVWTQEQADADLRSRLESINSVVTQAVRVRIAQQQRAALASFAYNVGTTAFLGSTLLRKLNASDYVGAAAEFKRWNRAGGTVMRGLTARRAAEAALFREGIA